MLEYLCTFKKEKFRKEESKKAKEGRKEGRREVSEEG